MEIVFRQLLHSDLANLAWSGSSLHLKYIGEQLKRTANGGVEIIAGILDNKLIAKGEIDYIRYPGFATFAMVNVKDEFQGQGIGTLLFTELERRARLQGESKARLHVEISNKKAVALYLRLGYSNIGEVTEKWGQFDSNGNIEEYEALCYIFEKEF